jgi:hypothetical protein
MIEAVIATKIAMIFIIAAMEMFSCEHPDDPCRHVPKTKYCEPRDKKPETK